MPIPGSRPWSLVSLLTFVLVLISLRLLDIVLYNTVFPLPTNRSSLPSSSDPTIGSARGGRTLLLTRCYLWGEGSTFDLSQSLLPSDQLILRHGKCERASRNLGSGEAERQFGEVNNHRNSKYHELIFNQTTIISKNELFSTLWTGMSISAHHASASCKQGPRSNNCIRNI